MTDLSLSRRRFLSALGAGAAALPLITAPGFLRAAGSNPTSGNILVLIELAGGNDGLNTVVPVTDPRYRHLRPSIGLDQKELLMLDRDTGLHSEMRGLAQLWERGDMRVIEGVGYPDPSRSHFRSIEIWNTGLGADSSTDQGWVSHAFSRTPPPTVDVDGLVLGGDMGPLRGAGRFSAMRDAENFAEVIEALPGMNHPVRPKGTSPLDHVLGTYDSARITGDTISAKLERSRDRRWDFPESDLAEQLRTAARLLDAGVEVPVLKVVQEGYDTHEAQPYVHGLLLGELSDAIAAFSRSMKDIGLWDQVTVVTYSEFGRTAFENASSGTDHGTAAPVFVTGGQVAGGFDGGRVDLSRLHDDDLVHTTDYRSVYSGILRDLWSIETPAFARPGLAPVRLFG